MILVQPWEVLVSSNPSAYPHKRRSSRIGKAIPVAVNGLDVSRAPYREEVTTVTISCHGCSYKMKHEVHPGDIVVLDMGRPANGRAETTSRARVKGIQKLRTVKDQVYDVAVEFETAGNIWGIPSPPADWFPLQDGKVVEPENPGRELRVMPRSEPQIAPGRSGVAPLSPLKKSETGVLPSQSLPDLMAGLSQQIQVMVSETAAVSLVNEKNLLIAEFRTQLEGEATKTIERVLTTSKEVWARRALKELSEQQEAAARANHERWISAIEQDLQNAKERMDIQGIEVSQRIDSMATSTIERLQRSLDTSRTEAAARFVSRLREQIEPLLEGAKGDLQKLVDTQNAFKEESREIETSVMSGLVEAHDELIKHSAVVLHDCHEKLSELSYTFEKATREGLQSLAVSSAEDVKKALKQRTTEIFNDFTNELEGRTRSYFEAISESIAEIPKKNSIR
jgi:hypothetical protein